MNHQQRVKEELIQAGFSKYALLKSESRKLPSIIHENEHIMAAVYGRTQAGSAMLIATDKRLLFLDTKPLFSIMDEINYEVISGIALDEQAGFAHIVLHSRVGDYTIRYANPTCAHRFAAFIEKARIAIPSGGTITAPSANTSRLRSISKPAQTKLPAEAHTFLATHEVGVLSTINRQNQPHGSTVYYTVSDNNTLHILTKSGTEKSRNIAGNHMVALTIYDAEKLQTLQMKAYAEIESSATIRRQVYEHITRKQISTTDSTKPPVTHLSEGSFTVIRLTPTSATFSDFGHKQ